MKTRAEQIQVNLVLKILKFWKIDERCFEFSFKSRMNFYYFSPLKKIAIKNSCHLFLLVKFNQKDLERNQILEAKYQDTAQLMLFEYLCSR